MSIADFVTRARVLLGDQQEDEFTDAEIMLEVQSALLELNTELEFYVRTEGLPMKEDVIDYIMPTDALKLKSLRLDGPRGFELPLFGKNDVPLAQNTNVSGNNVYQPFGSRRDFGFYTPVAVRELSNNVLSLNQAFTAEDADSFPADGVWAQ